MIRKVLFVILCLTIVSCASTGNILKYGFLPGSDYQYYEPLNKVDLKGEKYKILVHDKRNSNIISCYEHAIPRDTELEGETGIQYFSNYLKAMVMSNNGIIDPTAEKTIEVQLNAISGDLKMVLYGHVYGLIEFDANVGDKTIKYCSSMVDGDTDAPLGSFSFDTRKGAFRKLVSGSTRRALEKYLHDLDSYESKK